MKLRKPANVCIQFLSFVMGKNENNDKAVSANGNTEK